MSESLADFRTRVTTASRVPLGSGLVLSQTQQDQGINSALKDYSVKAGVRKTVALTGDGPEYNLPSLISGWVASFTVVDVLASCFDIALGGTTLVSVDSNKWRVILRDSTPYLYTGVVSPYLEYLSPHSLGALAADTTIPATDLDIVANLAAARTIRFHAAEASDNTASSILGDSVNHGGVSRTLLDLADKYEADFAKWADARYSGTASAFCEWDLRNNTGRMLFHGKDRW